MKKNTYLLLVIVILFSSNMFSQDQIFLKSGEKIEAKILEVKVDEIKYKKFSNPEGPTFALAKNEIHMLIYENGETEIFEEKAITNPTENIGIIDTSLRKPTRNRGGAKIGMGAGLPIGDYSDAITFTAGADFSYLGEIAENFQIGGLLGYTHYFVDGYYYSGYNYYRDYEDLNVIMVAFSTRVYFGNRKFFGGLDLGYGKEVSDEVSGDIYYRPKFGFNFGVVNLIASYSNFSELQSINLGIEFNLTR